MQIDRVSKCIECGRPAYTQINFKCLVGKISLCAMCLEELRRVVDGEIEAAAKGA